MRQLGSALLLFLLASQPPAAESKIQNLVATASNGQVSVKFQLDNAFDDRQRVKSLQSGLPTSVMYVVEIYRDRPNWFDDGIARVRIEVVAVFNSLTREYNLTYRIDGRLVRTESFTDLAALEKRMSVIEERDLFAIGDRRAYKLKVRVKADLGRGWVLYMIPWQSSTRWRSARVRVAETRP